MAIETYEKGTWGEEVGVEEHAGGKLQGLIRAFQKGKSASSPTVPRRLRHPTREALT